jgi:hypothetical protein
MVVQQEKRGECFVKTLSFPKKKCFCRKKMADGGGYDKPRINWEANDLPKEFKEFIQHCTFVFNGPLDTKTEKQKVNYLLTYVGKKGREIYQTFEFDAGDAEADPPVPPGNEVLHTVWSKFEEYVRPRTNQIRTPVHLLNKKQESSEKFDEFIMSLKTLVKDCDYGEHENRMVRDAIVTRCKDREVMKRCLETGDQLSLDEAIKIGRDIQAAQASVSVFSEDVTVKRIQRNKSVAKTKDNKEKNHHSSRTKQYQQYPKTKTMCTRCGRKHGKDAQHIKALVEIVIRRGTGRKCVVFL